jgi:hypothetical protein
MICYSKLSKRSYFSEGVACWTCNLVGRTMNACGILMGKPLVMFCFLDEEEYRKVILKRFLEKSVVRLLTP